MCTKNAIKINNQTFEIRGYSMKNVQPGKNKPST